ncbi:MAG: PDZ domain-containing protein [Verrucomicrobia bacterium]|nr:PDZ domain-containing protein [Verrucomicrobiota bacterium]
MTFRLLLCALLSTCGVVLAKEAAPHATIPALGKPISVVRVNVTNQPYDFLRPWSKRPPFQRRAVGAVLPGSRVLTTAEQVADATYLEMEKPDSGEKCPATVEVVDYDCNLALVKPSEADFLKPFKPLALAEPGVGDDLAIWQLENNGTLLNTRALLTTVEVGSYPIGDAPFLLYRLTSSLQQRDSGFTSPVVKNGALAGMLLRFDSRSQTADAIPAPVIRHFLKAAESKNGYIGFPRAGMGWASLRDPQLRRYAGLTNGIGGVYITRLDPAGAAAKAGIRAGDVLLSIGNTGVDRDGNYIDPNYGKVSVSHLLSCEHFTGEKLPFKLMRQGKEFTCEVTLTHPDPSASLIEPYSIDKAPRYYILGGVVFQELSRQFLKEWGPEWTRKAPERFLYYDTYQQELFKNDPRERIVILSNVLPSPCTVGYEELNCLVVTQVNGVALKSLADIEGALAKPINGFHHIQVEGSPGEIVLDPAEVSEIEPALIRNYNLPGIKRL